MELMVARSNAEPFHPVMWIDPAQAAFVVLPPELKVDDSLAWYGRIDNGRAIFGYVSDLTVEQALQYYFQWLRYMGCEKV